MGSLHESELSFDRKRHFKFNSWSPERLSWGWKDPGESKYHFGLKLVSDSCTNHLTFLAILGPIHLSTWMKFPILQTIFILAIINVDFISEFHSRVKSRSKFTWFWIDILVRNEFAFMWTPLKKVAMYQSCLNYVIVKYWISYSMSSLQKLRV